MSEIKKLRSLQEQGLVERIDLEDSDGSPSDIVKIVMARLRKEHKKDDGKEKPQEVKE